MAYESGKLGKVTVGVTDVNVTGWTFDFTEESLDTTNTGDGGYHSSIGGVISGSGTFTANWDSAAQATDNPPNIRPGATPVTIELYIGDPANLNFFDLDNVRITGCNLASTVPGLVTYTASFECTGTWNYPT